MNDGAGMYDPVRDGVEKSVQAVIYTEIDAPSRFSDVVHCYWELKTDAVLPDDFTLHALPDACVNILFDRLDVRIAGVTALQTTHTKLNLGTRFHYVGIQFYPGVWRGDPEGVVDHYVGEPYVGTLPLIATNQRLAGHDLATMESVFSELVDDLLADGFVAPNPMTSRILGAIGEIHTVADMASVAGLSTRQLQRTLKATTGFSPHDLLKVLRLQHAMRHDYLPAFADQSHFTHSFRTATGYTPGRFRQTFDI